MDSSSEDLSVCSKQTEREKIEKDTENFLKNGGSINVVPTGFSSIGDNDIIQSMGEKRKHKVVFKSTR